MIDQTEPTIPEPPADSKKAGRRTVLADWIARPDNPLTQLPQFTRHFSLTAPHGVAALNAEVTRQASMIAYIDNFYLMVIIIVCSLPLLLLLRRPARRIAGGSATAHAMD